MKVPYYNFEFIFNLFYNKIMDKLKWIFLGTGGGRFVVFKGIRRAAGYLLEYRGRYTYVDPGPCALSALLWKKIDSSKIDSVFLTHKDLDHSASLNVILEAITEGGLKKRGRVFLPRDCLEPESILLSYLRESVQEVHILKPLEILKINEIEFHISPYHPHRDVKCMGFKLPEFSLSFITDTAFDEKILEFYKGMDNFIIHMVLFEPKEGIDHLSFREMQKVIEFLKPKNVIITHFGMKVIKAKPNNLALELTKNTGVNVIPAYDGMEVEFKKI